MCPTGGLADALTSDGGSSAIVLGKLDAPGNTALSTGSISAADTRFQRAAGIDEDPDRMIEDLLRQSGDHESERLTRRLGSGEIYSTE